MLASSVIWFGFSSTGEDSLGGGAGTVLGGGDDRNGDVGGAVVSVEELVVACNREIGNLRGATSCVGAGSSTRLGEDFCPRALALMSSISRLISSASTSSSSSAASLPIPRSSKDVFQDASPVDHRFKRALEGDSRTECVGRGGEREVVNMEDKDGPASSVGGVGSRLRP
jgi:hypothetical protein